MNSPSNANSTDRLDSSTGLVSFEVGEPFELDGKRLRAIRSVFDDGFICLRFEDADVVDDHDSDPTDDSF